MLQNAYFYYFLAKIGADTAENEQHFPEILPKTGNYPVAGPGEPRGTARYRAARYSCVVRELEPFAAALDRFAVRRADFAVVAACLARNDWDKLLPEWFAEVS